MDNFQKAQKMAKIHLIQKKLKEQNNELEQMVMELILAGNNKTQIAQILAIREKLSPQQERSLEMILDRLWPQTK
jgi:hypothetical protein